MNQKCIWGVTLLHLAWISSHIHFASTKQKLVGSNLERTTKFIPTFANAKL
jgi:hypothetical protein